MKVTVKVSNSFKKQAKPLLKKFHSLKKELTQLENVLIENPKFGIQIGQNSYKIRLSVKSKGKGKSGGVRIISHLETEIIGLLEIKEENIIVNLISIYDKGVTASISDKELRDLINALEYE